jgi:hypothetical protein
MAITNLHNEYAGFLLKPIILTFFPVIKAGYLQYFPLHGSIIKWQTHIAKLINPVSFSKPSPTRVDELKDNRRIGINQ